MNSQNSNEYVLNLLKQDANQILIWFRALEYDHYDAGKFNWLMLATSAASKAKYSFSNVSTESGKRESLKWAEVSVRAYNYLIKENDASIRDKAIEELIEFHTEMIKRWGSVPGHIVLDPQIPIDWFLGTLSLSVDDAKSLLEEPRTKNNKEVYKQLDEIFRHLSVIKSLVDFEQIVPSLSLTQWINLLDSQQ